jgi:hypothetical protein
VNPLREFLRILFVDKPPTRPELRLTIGEQRRPVPCEKPVCLYCDTTFTDECITHDPNSVVVALLAHQMRDHWEELVIARQAMMSAIERGKPLEYVPNPDMCHDQNCVLADILGFPHEIAEHKRVQQETPDLKTVPPGE